MQSGVVDLSAEQKQKLRELGEEFKNLSKSDKIVGYIKEHNEHRNYFNEKLSSENIDSLTESEFKELCKNFSWITMNRYFAGKRKKLSIKQGTADLGFIADKRMVIIPLMQDNKLVAYRILE